VTAVIGNFNYGDLAKAQVRKLEVAARAIDSAKARTVEAILAIGRELKAVHDILANNKDWVFQRWLRERCGFSVRAAYRCLQAIDACRA
jgi:hypothetical protein